MLSSHNSKTKVQSSDTMPIWILVVAAFATVSLLTIGLLSDTSSLQGITEAEESERIHPECQYLSPAFVYAEKDFETIFEIEDGNLFSVIGNYSPDYTYMLTMNDNGTDDKTDDTVTVVWRSVDCDESYAIKYSTFYDPNIPLDATTQEEIAHAASKYGIDPYLVAAIIWQETTFRNISGDSGDSSGYMQIQKKWHKARMEKLNCTDLMIPSENFIVGCDYLSELIEKYGSVEYALTAYNSGSSGKSKYANEVLEKYEILSSGAFN